MALKGFSQEMIEKIDRLCDLLESIEKSEFLSKRLSLYGGTALNFLYLDQPRLSEDIDFNYRHIDDEDWGEVRDKIDEDLKWVIKSLDYKDEQLNINPKHNQCRFHLSYTSERGIDNDIKIEIGYMRRYPDLKEDTFRSFKHLKKGRGIKVMTPKREELFANKFATMISRSRTYLNLRDIFDVHSISAEEFEHRLFLELVALEIIMMDMPYSFLTQIRKRLNEKEISGRLDHLLKDELHIENILRDVIPFSEKIVGDLQSKELDTAIDHFHKTGELDLEKFNFKNEFHPRLHEHPQLQWLRKQKRESS